MRSVIHRQMLNILLFLLGIMMLSSMVLLSSSVFADDDSVVDEINIDIPVSCTMTGTGMNSHNAEIGNGQYNSAIGLTELRTYCNDRNGFAIYAIAYTDDHNGKDVMTSAALSSADDIPTGILTNGSSSQWAMKVSTVTSPEPAYPIAIQSDTEGSFENFHTIPNDYTMIAKRTSNTDVGSAAEGSLLGVSYQVYISPTQAAGTYTGQVKYTLVHPNDDAAPLSTMLEDGYTVYEKMQTIVAEEELNNTGYVSGIKAIKMANSLPAGFEATENNTVSTGDSKYPIYIFFDDTNDASTIYFYTEGDAVGMNPDSSYMLYGNTNLVDVSGLAGFDASRVVDMSGLFADCSNLTTLTGVEDWDTSNVERMTGLFYRTTELSDISALANWDTSNVITMREMFSENESITSLASLANWDTGKVEQFTMTFYFMSSLTDISALAGWDTSSATNMSYMFAYDPEITAVNLPNWDTGNVTDMSYMFSHDESIAYINAANWDTSKVTNMKYMFHLNKSATSINVSNWDTGNVTNMGSMFNVGESYVANGQLVEIIGLGNFDTSNVTDMTCMFYGAGQMVSYDIANWDVSKVTSFNHMFTDNRKLESLDLSRWDVSSVKTIENMFDDNYKLVTIGDVSHWKTSNLIDGGGWLNHAESFVGDNGTLDLSGWDTSSLKSTNEMFRSTKLQTIDLTGWTFDSITNDSWPGAGSGIYYEYTTGMGIMFLDTPYLNAVYLSQSGLNSFNAAVSRGVETTNMWKDSGVSGFVVRQ